MVCKIEICSGESRLSMFSSSILFSLKKTVTQTRSPLGRTARSEVKLFCLPNQAMTPSPDKQEKAPPGDKDLFIWGEVCGICLSSEWPVRERKQICILGQHARAGAKQHACFITQRKEEATIRTQWIVKQWNMLNWTGKRWRPSTCDVSLGSRSLKLH